MSTINKTSFKINDWLVDPATLTLQKGEKIIRLEPKVMQVLVCLAEQAGVVVTRQALEEQVWSGTVVGYDAVTNTIIKLRKAFGDKARNPAFIETIPKTGYRLIATVTPVIQETDKYSEPEISEVADTQLKPVNKSFSRQWILSVLAAFAVLLLLVFWWWPPAENKLPLPDEPSIAVMPFVNSGNNPQQNYFSDGITEDLIIELSNISGLFVIARNSSFSYKGRAVDVKQAAHELGVRFILQGSVRRNANQVRINVQLMDGADGRNVWAEHYDTPLGGLFAIQDDVTRKIVDALAVRLTNQEAQQLGQTETLDPLSYDEFLKGWERYWRFSRDDFAVAEQHFKQALAIDPGNSRAHAGLALIYWQAWQQKWHENFGNPHAGWTRARRELKQAMVKPTPLAHSTLSSMYLINRRYDEAMAEAEKAIALNKNIPGGYLALADAYSYSGQPGKAIETAQKGMRFDPNFSAPYLLVIGRAQFDMQLYPQAEESLQRAIAVNPNDRDAHILLIATYGYQLKQPEKAEPLLTQLNQQHARQKLRPFTVDWLKNRWPYRRKHDRDHLLDGLRKAGVEEW